MKLDEIETFLAVWEHSNIAHAANQLYIGQGTASSRVLRLEEELGVQLFVRQKGLRNVVLTPEGEYFSLLPSRCFLFGSRHSISKTV